MKIKQHNSRWLTKATLLLTFGLICLAPAAKAEFGLTTSDEFYTVDTGAGLVFKIRRLDYGSHHQSPGDIASMVYHGVEYQDQYKGSQINSGFDWLYHGTSAVSVSAKTVGDEYVKITVVAGYLTHYYIARKGDNAIYMATYFTKEPQVQNLVRYIVRIPRQLLPNGPTPSDIHNTTSTVEAHDIFRLPDGETRSKHYSNHRLIDWRYTGATGDHVGIWMVRSNNEGGSGGPFYRCLINQCGGDQELYNITNYGEAQTEPYRLGILDGPYILAFTNGGPPPVFHTEWLGAAGLNLKGYVPRSQRGRVIGRATGVPSGFQAVVGFANDHAQYWCIASKNGQFHSPAMIPGTYTQTLYKGELAVATKSVTVTAQGAHATVRSDIASNEYRPPIIWRIGEWDGTPKGFLNADKVTHMHPSDVRITSWSHGDYIIGTSTPADFPCYQWKGVNNPVTIKFTLTPEQAAKDHTLRIGLTCALFGGRDWVNVNGWNSPIPAPPSEPRTRTLTVGTYRGNNVTYTYDIPASALVPGTNTMTLTVVSGSGYPTGFLSAGISYDAVELDQ